MVVGKLLEAKEYNFGYDAQTGEYGDLVKLGIIDPTKVVRTALQDAASIAGLIVTTEATITEHPKSEAPPLSGGFWQDVRHTTVAFLNPHLEPSEQMISRIEAGFQVT